MNHFTKVGQMRVQKPQIKLSSNSIYWLMMMMMMKQKRGVKSFYVKIS